ncbi:MAG: hypothetical protein HYZ16_05360 [Bacteroidetes bacterium]|nr:hypothetical protein [Bacteroidota bacterium]
MFTHLFTPCCKAFIPIFLALGPFSFQAIAQQGSLGSHQADTSSVQPDTSLAQAIENDLPIAAKPSIAPYVMNNRLPVPIGVIVFALVFVGLVVFLLYKYKVL